MARNMHEHVLTLKNRCIYNGANIQTTLNLSRHPLDIYEDSKFEP